MSEAQKSPFQIAYEGFEASAERAYVEIEHYATEYHLPHAQTVENLLALKSIGEVTLAIKAGIDAAQRDDWDEFSAKMIEASDKAANTATEGGWGQVEGLLDAAAALYRARGGEDYSVGTVVTEKAIDLSNKLSDLAFRLTPNAEVSDAKITTINGVYALGHGSNAFAENTVPVGPNTVFAPMDITRAVGPDTVFTPVNIYPPAGSGFDSMVIPAADAMVITSVDTMLITAADAMVITADTSGPGFYDQIMSTAPDFDPGGFQAAIDFGTVPDGGMMGGFDPSPDFGVFVDGGLFSPTGGDIAGPGGDFGGVFGADPGPSPSGFDPGPF